MARPVVSQSEQDAVQVDGMEAQGRTFAVLAPSPSLRGAAIALRLVAAIAILFFARLLARSFFGGAPSPAQQPWVLPAQFVVFVGVPLAIAWIVDLLTTGVLHVEPQRLVLKGDKNIEISRAELSGVQPLLVPLPRPGLTLSLRSGRHFERTLCTRELPALLATLVVAGAPRATSAIAFAAALPRRRSRAALILGVGVMPLIISVVLFRLHQYIRYGGAFGEYYAKGLGAYLTSFAIEWADVTTALLVIGGAARIFVELASFLAASIKPEAARVARTAASWIAGLVYFGSVPAFLAARLLS